MSLICYDFMDWNRGYNFPYDNPEEWKQVEAIIKNYNRKWRKTGLFRKIFHKEDVVKVLEDEMFREIRMLRNPPQTPIF